MSTNSRCPKTSKTEKAEQISSDMFTLPSSPSISQFAVTARSFVISLACARVDLFIHPDSFFVQPDFSEDSGVSCSRPEVLDFKIEQSDKQAERRGV
ncbi:hypothetical protein Trydic_g2031 [Trypoxylus dichotomus]